MYFGWAENEPHSSSSELSISAISPNTLRMESHERWKCFTLDRFLCNGVITCTKRAPHVSHLYGFSPEWMRVWVLRLAGRLNWAPQMLQRYGFSPEEGKSDQKVTNQQHRLDRQQADFLLTYLCGQSCGSQGCPCSGKPPGSGHTCMACRCALEACVVSALRLRQTWSHIRCRRMCRFLRRNHSIG